MRKNKIKKANETLDILYINGNIKRRFKGIYFHLQDKKILILVFGVAVNGVIMNINYTKLCSITGTKVLHYIYLCAKIYK